MVHPVSGGDKTADNDADDTCSWYTPESSEWRSDAFAVAKTDRAGAPASPGNVAALAAVMIGRAKLLLANSGRRGI